MSYFKNIFTTGAISKTPTRVLEKIMDQVGDQKPNLIVELGAGKGEITRHITGRLGNSLPPYYAFEIHADFATELQSNFPMINVLQKDALQFSEHIPGKADLIICSIPVSFFSKSDRRLLLEQIRNSLAPNGKAVILFHAFWVVSLLKRYFPGSRLITLFHIPPYFILTYRQPKPE